MPDFQPDGSPWPRISIITPSYNQGQYIEETIRSILLQGYPNLEYCVIDGGSTDQTVDIIKAYETHLSWWTSERDRGQSHAINKGLAHCTGEIFNWINSDDLLMPGALGEVARKWTGQPGCIVSGGTDFFNEQGVFSSMQAAGQTLAGFVRFWEAANFGWAQQSTFLPLSEVQAIGGIREDLRYSMDYHMMVRLLQRSPSVAYVNRTLAGFRFHDKSKTVGESQHFRLERVNMLRSMEGLSIKVSEWEWDREQAKRLVDIALRDLRGGRFVSGATNLGRAVATSPVGSMRELGSRAAGKLIRRLHGLGPAVRRKTRQNGKPSICLVAHYAYGAICGGTVGHIGGVERQTSLMARWFAARGYTVSMLTWDERGLAEEMIDGVRLVKLCRRDAGIPGLRFFWPRWSSLVQAMRKADADVYYHNCAEYVTGQVALWCRHHERKFVYSVASEPDVDRTLPEMYTLRERVLYRYGLRCADRIVVQTESQRMKLHDGFGLDSTVIPMPCLGPLKGEYVPPTPPEVGNACVLWVARICEQKRPDRLADLAEACPDLQFDVVGPVYESQYAQASASRLRGLPNVVVHGSVPRERMPEFYRQAACLLCTSDVEGFPNTFLEAWSHGLPVVSSFDPDGLIAARGFGAFARDIPGLVAGLRLLLSSRERWLEASAKARRYYLENHTVEAVMPQFERLFLDVVKRNDDKQG